MEKISTKIKEPWGYSLIEAVVSLSIIAVITTVFMANYKDANESSKLNLAAHQLASDLRRVQSNALGLKKAKNGDFPPGGWGIYVNRNNPNNLKYTIFADINDPDGDHFYNSGEEQEVIDLPPGISIDNIYFNNTPRVSGAVTFTAPNPDTYFCRNTTQCYVGIFEIKLTNNNGNFKYILVNSYGLIDVNDTCFFPPC